MVNSQQNQFKPDYAVSPGAVLDDELAQRGISRRELVKMTGIPAKDITAIMKAKSAITPQTAIKFEYALGMPTQYWLNLEENYQTTLARIGHKPTRQTPLHSSEISI